MQDDSTDMDIPLSATYRPSSTVAGASKVRRALSQGTRHNTNFFQDKGKGVDRPQPSKERPRPTEKENKPIDDSLFSAPSSPEPPLSQLPPTPDPKGKAAQLPRIHIPPNPLSVPGPATASPQLPPAGPSKHIPSHRAREMNPRVQMMPMQGMIEDSARARRQLRMYASTKPVTNAARKLTTRATFSEIPC